MNSYSHYLCLILLLPLLGNAQVIDVDGNEYKTKEIGTQSWMIDNLDVSKFKNGDIILEAKNIEDWNEAIESGKPMYCYYDFDKKNGETYGKLYNWFAVKDKRGLAPEGWHIPSLGEFNILIKSAGGVDEAGGNLISSSLWENKEEATNETGFSALPSGTLYNSGNFEDLGAISYFWTRTIINETRIHYIDIWSDSCFGAGVDNNDEAWIEEGLSVRCLKD